MPPPEIRFERRARPQGGQRLVIAAAALAAGAGAAWLAHAIDSDPARGWGLAIAAGVVVTALVGWFAMLGSRIVVDAGGLLTYSLHGRPNLVLDLREALDLRPVSAGLLRGVGVVIPAERIRFLHKAGISPERMRRWREALGVDLVLEGFPAETAGELQALRVELPPVAAGAPPSPA